MRRELEDKLKEDFPTIFCDMYDSSPMESCMYDGIHASDGWHDIIRTMCEKIMALGPPEGFKACQVKEKFGGLRFYTTGCQKEIHDLVSEAENESYKTCETCGSKENVTCEGRPNWVSTLCSSCASA